MDESLESAAADRLRRGFGRLLIEGELTNLARALSNAVRFLTVE
jgi:hypothetical protein